MMTPEPFLIPAKKRRRPGLSLRALMALVLILGGGLGWLAHRARVQRVAVEAIEKAGGKVGYDFRRVTPRPDWQKWLGKTLGRDYVETVGIVFLRWDEGAKADDDLLAQVGRLDGLELLYLGGSLSVTDAGLVQLQGHKQLKVLDLARTGVRGPGLQHLAGLPQLAILYLDELPIGDSDLAHLEPLRSLEELMLSETPITDQGLAHLEGLTNLEELSLGHTSVTSLGLRHLAPLTRLQHLALQETRVESVEPLVSLHELQGLVLNGSRVTDAGLASLERFDGLVTLGLLNTRITDAGVSHVGKMKKLATITLCNTELTDEGLSCLGGMTSLEFIDVGDTKITDAGLAKLNGLANCRELSLNGARVTPAGIDALKARWPLMKIHR